MTKNTSHNKDGFSIPDNYFEESKKNILNSLNPKEFENKNEDQGFSVPKNYHSNFNKAIISKVNPKPIYFLSKKVIHYSLAIAASMVLFFVVLNKNNGKNTFIEHPIVSTDTIQTLKETIKNISFNEQDDDLLAIYVDNSYADENLEDYALDDLISYD